MSRSVKDLRELICLSRLSIRQSESSEDDDNDGCNLDDTITNQSVASPDTTSHFYDHIVQKKAPDISSAKPGSSSYYGATPSKKRNNEIIVGRPKSAVGGVRRPILASERGACKENADTYDGKIENDYTLSSCDMATVARISESCSDRRIGSRKKKIYDDDLIQKILRYTDANVISGWLQRCNRELDEIVRWLKQGHNFIRFADFMLNQFHYAKRKDLIDMEVSFILNEFELAFKVGIRDKTFRIQDLRTLLQVVISEYPARLHGRKGSNILLNMLLTFSCGKNEAYKKLLADVKFSTSNKQYIQWLLAMRAFGLISLSNGVIDFYKQLTGLENYGSNVESKEMLDCTEDFKFSWLIDAIELKFLDVFKCLATFFVETCEGFSINQRQIIISKAITTGYDQILQYLFDKVISFFAFEGMSS